VTPREPRATPAVEAATAAIDAAIEPTAIVAPAAPVLPAKAEPRARGVERTDALSRYLSQLRDYAPISREEEHELALRWTEHGDVEAARKLVLANLRLVVKIAMEYRRTWTNVLDLIQEGNVGLMQAVQRFDPNLGVKLSSYAAYWIRAYVLKYLLDNIRLVRLGTTRAQRKLFFRLNKEKRELERLGIEVEPKMIAERLDVTEDDVIDMEQRLGNSDLSFDAPIRDDDSSATYGDFIPSRGPSTEESVADDELRRVFLEKVHAFAETLDERDRRIVDERILAEEPKTLQEMGDAFGVTRERVRQLEARVVSRLRDYLKENLVDFEYYDPAKD
jgi:RNA polymerase sigma-32 factor